MENEERNKVISLDAKPLQGSLCQRVSHVAAINGHLCTAAAAVPLIQKWPLLVVFLSLHTLGPLYKDVSTRLGDCVCMMPLSSSFFFSTSFFSPEQKVLRVLLLQQQQRTPQMGKGANRGAAPTQKKNLNNNNREEVEITNRQDILPCVFFFKNQRKWPSMFIYQI